MHGTVLSTRRAPRAKRKITRPSAINKAAAKDGNGFLILVCCRGCRTLTFRTNVKNIPRLNCFFLYC
ncbi:MAG: hypothetical protein LIP28_10630 [Deltaproteobacteria bacterium]|nr:hypothetical protein [Deltaproteobacteria bacterium]